VIVGGAFLVLFIAYGTQYAFSLLFTLGAPPVALGPVAAGWIYDHTGGYALAWWPAAAFNALALGLVSLARPPRPVAERRAAVVISPTTS
jgi:hypothetical protein